MPTISRPAQSPPMRVTVRTFPPIYNGLPVCTEDDPFGLRPLNRRIRKERGLILQWDAQRRELVIWEWPVVDEQRVPPSELNALRLSHNFRGPCCLCASQSNENDAYTEASIFLVTTGTLIGQYVAACARSACKYWVFLEKLYPRPGLPIRAVFRRALGSARPPAIPEPAVVDDDDQEVVGRRRKRSNGSEASASASGSSAQGSSPLRTNTVRANEDDDDLPPLVRARKRARLNAQPRESGILDQIPQALPGSAPPDCYSKAETFRLCLDLDRDQGLGGISEQQFSKLFRRCLRCRTVTTSRIFKYHRCALPNVEVIDLTINDDDN